MTRSELQRAVEEILDVPKNSLRDADTRDTVASWTSIADVQIMTMISGQLGIEPDVELLEAESWGDLVRVLEGKDAFAA